MGDHHLLLARLDALTECATDDALPFLRSFCRSLMRSAQDFLSASVFASLQIPLVRLSRTIVCCASDVFCWSAVSILSTFFIVSSGVSLLAADMLMPFDTDDDALLCIALLLCTATGSLLATLHALLVVAWDDGAAGAGSGACTLLHAEKSSAWLNAMTPRYFVESERFFMDES